MALGDSSTDDDMKPLLDNDSTLVDQDDDDRDTCGFVVNAGNSPTTRLSLETTTTTTTTTTEQIPISHTMTDTPIATETTTVTMDEAKCCRICGEGEEEIGDDDDDDYYGYRQHHDEESLIGTPMIPTTTMTRQQPPGSGYSQLMTRDENDMMTTIAMQHHHHHHHTEDPSITPTIPSTTKQQQCNKVRKQKKWIQPNILIRPCRCSGTMMYVHVSCLNHWRSLSPRASSYVACDLCGYEYNIYRPRYAVIVTNPYFLRIMTMLLVVMAILACSYLCKLVDIYLLGHFPRPDNEDWIQLHGISSWLWMDRFYLFAGLIVISMLGMVYLAYLCVTRPDEMTFITNHSIGEGGGDGEAAGLSFFCCDQTSCPWYTFYLADFAACSGDSAAGGFLIFVVLISLLAIFFGVFGAVTGVFRFMESWVDSIAGHIKERILDVD